VPTGKVKEVAAMLKAIHAQEDAKAAKERAQQVVARLREIRLGKAAEIVENGIEETLSYYAMPPEHWRCIKTNNPLERLMREIRRRTRVVGAFPDGHYAGRRQAATCCRDQVGYEAVSADEPARRGRSHRLILCCGVIIIRAKATTKTKPS